MILFVFNTTNQEPLGFYKFLSTAVGRKSLVKGGHRIGRFVMQNLVASGVK